MHQLPSSHPTPPDDFFRSSSGRIIPHCDPKVLSKGVIVFKLGQNVDENEDLIKKVRALGYRVDWHFTCGGGVAKTLDDPETVKKVFERVSKGED